MTDLGGLLGDVLVVGATIYVIDKVTGKKKKIVVKRPVRAKGVVRKIHKKVIGKKKPQSKSNIKRRKR